MREYTIITERFLRAILSAAAVGAVLFSGCVKRDLEERTTPPIPADKGYAEITLDWGDDTPRSARCLFYDQTGALASEVQGVTSVFKGFMKPGRYRLIVHNEDAKHVEYRGLDDFATAEVYAQPATSGFGFSRYGALSLPQTRSEVVPSILEPEDVFSACGCRETGDLVITGGQATRATVELEERTREVEFHFTVESDRGVRSLEGLLTGVVPGIFLASGKSDVSASCMVGFTASQSTKAASSDYRANVGIFNLLTTAESPEGTTRIFLALTDMDGEIHEGYFDLTQTIQQIIEENGGDIPIEIPLSVQLHVQELGGLSATVEPWDDSGSGGGDPRPQR